MHNRDEKQILSLVLLNQLLWTAGYSLTTSRFLYYFASDLGANAWMIAVLHVIPETFGVLGLTSRLWIKQFRSRKKTFLWFSLVARAVSLLIPLFAFVQLGPENASLLWFFAAIIAVVHICQAVAYLAYISWLSDLVNNKHWGQFFAWRNIAKICVLLVVPVSGGFLRDWWKQNSAPSVAMWAYVATYLVGTILMVCSLWPMLRLSAVPVKFVSAVKQTQARGLRGWYHHRSLLFLYIHNWWLAFFNGLTQSVFFSFLFGSLHISLGWFYVLLSIMRVVKLPVSYYSGKYCDHNKDKQILMFSLLGASSGLLFWMMATPAQPLWVAGGYAAWGLFAAANISGRNLLLKLAPSSDNATELALFRQVGGMLAGLSGLLGGFLLQRMLNANSQWELYTIQVTPFQLLFAISLLGRYLALLWLIPVRESRSPQ